ncbi:DNA repair protein Rad60 [Megachile rotundata]|uniref:DNA repair protein Rad60 n=1 Tax=Megachile rotundata TaxID=143995 RepID=UPI000258ED1F|nr:PREDICTED: uncharacterized protein CG4449 [Megachile rotundata]
METMELDSSSEDDDVYLNCVAKLKALKKQQTLHIPNRKDEEEAEKEKEVLKIQVPEENVVVQSTDRRLRSRRRGRNSGKAQHRKEIPSNQDEDSDLEIVSVEEKPNSSVNDILLDDNCVDEILYVDGDDEEDYDLTIKILWRSKDMHRLTIRNNENFRKIFEYFADLEKVPIDEILITKKEKTIKKNDTPTSINLSVIDILEGGIIKKDGTMLQDNEEDENDGNTCIIKVQTTNKKTITASVKRDENFKVVLAKCAQDLNVEESKIKLYFDGELVTLTDTPDSLDIEDEACFDLRLSS